MLLGILILATAATAFAALTFSRSVRQSEAWTATVTPLASIMGSGFLVSAPLLAGVVGNYSPLVMAALLFAAWNIGGAVRFNISHVEKRFGSEDSDSGKRSSEKRSDHAHFNRHRLVAQSPLSALEGLSHLVLAFAYFISITFYIQLLAQFSLSMLGSKEGHSAQIVASLILAGISLVGYFAGLKLFEKLERYAINLNLAMICGLLTGLTCYNLSLLWRGDWRLPEIELTQDPWTRLRICMGLLIVVQGFEISRFLGEEHSAKLRIRTMGWAQLISTVIYLTFLSLMLTVITPDEARADADVTAIIKLSTIVSSILPFMITIAAVGSQFSAAVADAAGSGGLLSHLAGRYLSSRTVYLLIGAVTVTLVWSVDVLQVIALASRAFAAFYALQCLVAAWICWSEEESSDRQAVWYVLWAFVAAAVAVLGKSTE